MPLPLMPLLASAAAGAGVTYIVMNRKTVQQKMSESAEKVADTVKNVAKTTSESAEKVADTVKNVAKTTKEKLSGKNTPPTDAKIEEKSTPSDASKP
jgi:hypothetical protein